MNAAMKKMFEGYQAFREKYASGDTSLMQQLADHGQSPAIMVVGCSDSRVDPALILQCDPGDLFTVRNVANIVPPFRADDAHDSTSAALEFGICYLNVQHLVILGHSQCGGMKARFSQAGLTQDDFISDWVAVIDADPTNFSDAEALSQHALLCSYRNCLTFPWIKQRVEQKQLAIHLWFFDIKQGSILRYSFADKQYERLTAAEQPV